MPESDPDPSTALRVAPSEVEGREESLPDRELPDRAGRRAQCFCEPTGFNTVRSCESTEYSVNG